MGQWENRTNSILDSSAQPQSSAGEDMIYWSKTEFTIPFHVDGTGKQPSEVQLEVSSDSGRTWSLYARDSLQARQFRFAARTDGLYLFRIKTIDDLGKAFDPGGEPLRVLVDTQSPELQLNVDCDVQGRMVAQFSIDELHPKSDWIRLEFQSDINERWTSIPFTVQKNSDNQTAGTGKWDIAPNTRQLAVRLIVRDAAGNEAEVTRLPLLPKTANFSTGLQFASGPSSPPSVSHRTATNTNNTAGAIPNKEPMTANRSILSRVNQSNTPPRVSNGNTQGSRYTFNSIESKAEKPLEIGSVPSPSNSSNPARNNLAESSNDPLFLELPGGSSSQGFIPSAPQVPSLGRSASAQIERYSPEKEQTNTLDIDTVTPLGTTESPNAKPFYSKSRAFSLDYEVDTVTSSPVASVELWGTTDAGKSWDMWGTDPDGKSPFDIKVETEGLFGFRMVIVGVNGLASNRPRNGDNADAWIHVDTQVPVTIIQSALYGRGTETGSLIIDYSAKDDFFGPRPISLAYSELPTGPWTTIATGLKNTGRYAWPADPNLPRRIYLKISAFDEAGNVGEYRLDLPIDVEGLAPRGRIQGFRPIVGNDG